MRDYVSETVVVGDREPVAGLLQTEYVVRAYSILSTDLVAFDVYVVASHLDGFGSSFHSDEHGRLAQLTSARPVDSTLALPYGEERTRLVGEHYEALRAARDEAVRLAFPGVCPDRSGLTSVAEFRRLPSRTT